MWCKTSSKLGWLQFSSLLYQIVHFKRMRLLFINISHIVKYILTRHNGTYWHHTVGAIILLARDLRQRAILPLEDLALSSITQLPISFKCGGATAAPVITRCFSSPCLEKILRKRNHSRWTAPWAPCKHSAAFLQVSQPCLGNALRPRVGKLLHYYFLRYTEFSCNMVTKDWQWNRVSRPMFRFCTLIFSEEITTLKCVVEMKEGKNKCQHVI